MERGYELENASFSSRTVGSKYINTETSSRPKVGLSFPNVPITLAFEVHELQLSSQSS